MTMNIFPALPFRAYICSRCSLLSRGGQYSLRRHQAQQRQQQHRLNHAVLHPTRGRPLRLAVIGSGPAGFYAASRVMSRLPTACVDMYESLPAPFGLVRYGVAPDHPEVKNCQERFVETAASSRFQFIGNVAIGADLPLRALIPHYDAILLAYGASKDRELGVPGENTLGGIYSARAFVGWYNGLPEYADLAPILGRGEEAVIVGQGNVALDVARILLSDVDTLRKTDIAAHALETLSRRNGVKRVRVVGRRGPMQAAFTIKELRELLTLPDVGFVPVNPNLIPTLKEDLAKLPRAQKRMAQLLTKSAHIASGETHDGSKLWQLDFFSSPTAFLSDDKKSEPDHLSHVAFARTRLRDLLDPFSPGAAVATVTPPYASSEEEPFSVPTTLAFRSIGYKSEPLPGLAEAGVPFDERRGIIPNDQHGRIVSTVVSHEMGLTTIAAKILPGFYTAGWAKRGPTGVIATTMSDAFDTADAICSDWTSSNDAPDTPFLNDDNPSSMRDGWDGVRQAAGSRGLRPVSWEDWLRIDSAERERGKVRGVEREKFTRVPEMLQVLDS